MGRRSTGWGHGRWPGSSPWRPVSRRPRARRGRSRRRADDQPPPESGWQRGGRPPRVSAPRPAKSAKQRPHPAAAPRTKGAGPQNTSGRSRADRTRPARWRSWGSTWSASAPALAAADSAASDEHQQQPSRAGSGTGGESQTTVRAGFHRRHPGEHDGGSPAESARVLGSAPHTRQRLDGRRPSAGNRPEAELMTASATSSAPSQAPRRRRRGTRSQRSRRQGSAEAAWPRTAAITARVVRTAPSGKDVRRRQSRRKIAPLASDKIRS